MTNPTHSSERRRSLWLRAGIIVVGLGAMAFNGDACICGGARQRPDPPPQGSTDTAPAPTATDTPTSQPAP